MSKVIDEHKYLNNKDYISHSDDISVLNAYHQANARHWIPAFAGMTGMEGGALFVGRSSFIESHRQLIHPSPRRTSGSSATANSSAAPVLATPGD
jgi:hypothetical protein